MASPKMAKTVEQYAIEFAYPPSDCTWLEYICDTCGTIRWAGNEEYLVICPLCNCGVVEIKHKAHGKTTQPLPSFVIKQLPLSAVRR